MFLLRVSWRTSLQPSVAKSVRQERRLGQGGNGGTWRETNRDRWELAQAHAGRWKRNSTSEADAIYRSARHSTRRQNDGLSGPIRS